MKKTISNIYIWATIVVATIAFAACSSDDGIVEDQQPTGTKTYTMTVQASKGGKSTRALALDETTTPHKLNATWAEGERVTVYNVTKDAALEGYLEAQSDGASTTLKGELTGTIEKDDVLKLKFLSPTYGTQDGTLTGNPTSIDKVCDYAEATVTVSAVSGSSITTSNATFTNQQAIVKFTLKKKADNSDLEIPAATALTVNDGTIDYTITPTSTTNVLFVAIPATSTVNLSTIIGGLTYSYEKTGAGLLAGKYYEITVKMSPRLYVKRAGDENYTVVTGNTTLNNGDLLTGVLFDNYEISIADGATVTLHNVTINGVNNSDYIWAGLNCLGDATINLADGTTNNVKGFFSAYPGIYVPINKTLTIQGTGTLNASSNGEASGIGGGPGAAGGNIIIDGGTVTAIGGQEAAGIGSGFANSCGDITIRGGTVSAIGGEKAAGIGSGYASSYCGNITITGGTVTATCGTGAAAVIGRSSENNSCGDITISGSPSVTLNNPNNSGFPVELSTFMNTGNTIYLALTEWGSGSSLEYVDAYMSEDDYYHVEFGCLTAQQFVYRPMNN